jgi:hypothetical protein
MTNWTRNKFLILNLLSLKFSLILNLFLISSKQSDTFCAKIIFYKISKTKAIWEFDLIWTKKIIDKKRYKIEMRFLFFICLLLSVVLIAVSSNTPSVSAPGKFVTDVKSPQLSCRGCCLQTFRFGRFQCDCSRCDRCFTGQCGCVFRFGRWHCFN